MTLYSPALVSKHGCLNFLERDHSDSTIFKLQLRARVQTNYRVCVSLVLVHLLYDSIFISENLLKQFSPKAQ